MDPSSAPSAAGGDLGSGASSPAASASASASSPGLSPDQPMGYVEELTIFFSSPVNVILTCIAAFIFYRIFKGKSKDDLPAPPPLPPPLPRRDMILEELHKYDGKGPDGRVCLAVNGKVFDVTKGTRFYGPGGPYAPLAGNDATRSLATFAVDAVKPEWDDVSDLTASEIGSAKEWELQFSERYDYVGRLVQTEAEIREWDPSDGPEGTAAESGDQKKDD